MSSCGPKDLIFLYQKKRNERENKITERKTKWKPILWHFLIADFYIAFEIRKTKRKTHKLHTLNSSSKKLKLTNFSIEILFELKKIA